MRTHTTFDERRVPLEHDGNTQHKVSKSGNAHVQSNTLESHCLSPNPTQQPIIALTVVDVEIKHMLDGHVFRDESRLGIH